LFKRIIVGYILKVNIPEFWPYIF